MFVASALTLGAYALYVLAGKAASLWKISMPWMPSSVWILTSVVTRRG